MKGLPILNSFGGRSDASNRTVDLSLGTKLERAAESTLGATSLLPGRGEGIQSLIQHCVLLLEHQSAANTELANALLAISSKTSVMGEMTPSDELLPPQGQPMTMLTVPRLAELLAVDPRTIRRWRSAGHLPPALSVGGVIRWRAEVIDQWIADREGER